MKGFLSRSQAMLHFAAAPGSEMYNGLEVGTTIYKCWAFQKSA